MEGLLGRLADAFQHTDPSLVAQSIGQSLQSLVDCPAIATQHLIGPGQQLSGVLAQFIHSHQKVLEHGLPLLSGSCDSRRGHLCEGQSCGSSQIIRSGGQPVLHLQDISGGHCLVVKILQRNTYTTNELVDENNPLVIVVQLRKFISFTITRVGDVVGYISQGMGALLLL